MTNRGIYSATALILAGIGALGGALAWDLVLRHVGVEWQIGTLVLMAGLWLFVMASLWSGMDRAPTPTRLDVVRPAAASSDAEPAHTTPGGMRWDPQVGMRWLVNMPPCPRCGETVYHDADCPIPQDVVKGSQPQRA